MKNYYKLYLTFTGPFSDSTIQGLNKLLPINLRGRVNVDNEDNQVASLILSSDNSGNPELDELSEFLLCLDDTDFTAFFGYPKDDWSNAITDDCGSEVWNLIDTCRLSISIWIHKTDISETNMDGLTFEQIFQRRRSDSVFLKDQCMLYYDSIIAAGRDFFSLNGIHETTSHKRARVFKYYSSIIEISYAKDPR